MKYLILLLIPILVTSCVSTSGSIDTANVPPAQADYIAKTMTAEIVRYPVVAVTPQGKPLFDAFNDEFRALGWDIRPSSRKELPNQDWQDRYIKIHSNVISNGNVLVQMKTPYFDLFQTFFYDKLGNIYETTNTTLHLKEHE